MIHFITYSNELYSKSREFAVFMAKKYGKVDTTTSYKPEDIDEKFVEEHKDILSVKSGNGLWLWKPYFINKKLSEINDDDVVLYCDAGSFFFKNCKAIIDTMNDDIWVSDLPLIEKQFTKPSLFELMNCKGERYTDTNQIQANFIAVRKNTRGCSFISEWLDWCCKKNTLSQSTEIYKNIDYYFIGHRSDQSVLSLLVKKWGIKPHCDPSQYGRVPEKYYSQNRLFIIPIHTEKPNPCIILHRKRKINYFTCFNQWVFTWIPKSFLPLISTPVRQVIKGKNNPEIFN